MKATIRSLGLVLSVLVLAVASCGLGQREPPTLVVLVSLDQVRGDLLERYDSLFSGGFRRLHDDGFRFLNATHFHSQTSTAAGHATLATGVFPSRSGIVGNEWRERTIDGWRLVYSVEDTLAHILGMPAIEGRSPKNLLRGGLADWISEADSGAIVVSGSRKDRAAITMAGKTRGHVYWITENEGRWVTSSFYADDYPGWIERLNRDDMPRIFGDSIWEQTVPPAARDASRPDTSQYEGDGEHSFFPHRFHNEVQNPERPSALNRWAYSQPHPDEALGIFAVEAVVSLGLGKDTAIDYLGLSFSQPDAIGHDYGPLSREQLDNLLHLDRVLGDLMGVLDREVGAGRWVMALTADHGVIDIPEHLAETGGQARRATREDFQLLRQTFQAFQQSDGDQEDSVDSLVAAVERIPFVADAMTVAELTTPPAADSFVTLMRNSYHPDRWLGGFGSQGSGVVFRFEEGYYPDASPRGTGHGSPYYYDRYVPLIFYGSGVEAGVSTDPVRTVDIAPTLAGLAGIPAPTDLDGQVLFR
jgi:predicted AlkP superfamily pyrophosphatase or phosphodiesterase